MKNIKTANVMLIIVLLLLIVNLVVNINAHKTETASFIGKKKK